MSKTLDQIIFEGDESQGIPGPIPDQQRPGGAGNDVDEDKRPVTTRHCVLLMLEGAPVALSMSRVSRVYSPPACAVGGYAVPSRGYLPRTRGKRV